MPQTDGEMAVCGTLVCEEVEFTWKCCAGGASVGNHPVGTKQDPEGKKATYVVMGLVTPDPETAYQVIGAAGSKRSP